MQTTNLKTFFSFLICVFSLTIQAGIGDIIGGSSTERQRFERILKHQGTFIEGDTIHFQEHSMWVKASLNKTLCFDGAYYQAVASLCVEFDSDQECVRTQRTRVFQPEMSTRVKCVKHDANGCLEYDEVFYRQNPVREITLRDRPGHHGSILAKALVRIRSCQ